MSTSDVWNHLQILDDLKFGGLDSSIDVERLKFYLIQIELFLDPGNTRFDARFATIAGVAVEEAYQRVEVLDVVE